MKIIYKFDPNEDADELAVFQNAKKLNNVYSEFYYFLRNKLKYEELTEEEDKIYSEIKDKFIEILNENEVVL